MSVGPIGKAEYREVPMLERLAEARREIAPALSAQVDAHLARLLKLTYEDARTSERERVIALFLALCNNDETVANVAQWIREGEQ